MSSTTSGMLRSATRSGASQSVWRTKAPGTNGHTGPARPRSMCGLATKVLIQSATARSEFEILVCKLPRPARVVELLDEEESCGRLGGPDGHLAPPTFGDAISLTSALGRTHPSAALVDTLGARDGLTPSVSESAASCSPPAGTRKLGVDNHNELAPQGADVARLARC